MTPYPYSHSYNKVIKLDRLSHLFGMSVDFYLDTKTFFFISHKKLYNSSSIKPNATNTNIF